MKKNMRKLASFLFMVMLVLGLTACGSAKESAETVVDPSYAETVSEFFLSNITGMTAEEMQFYLDMDAEDLQVVLDNSGIPVMAEAFQDIFSGYLSDAEVYGEYVSTDSYELEGDNEEAIQITKMTFSVHPATMTLVFDDDGVVTTGSFDPVYSTGEILEKAGLNTLIGMGTVFVVLIFISFIIALLPKLTALVEGKGKKEKAEAKAAAEAPKASAVPAVEEELTDDLELVAVISAAIAAYTGTSSDDFVVRSIKRSTSNKWKKA